MILLLGMFRLTCQGPAAFRVVVLESRNAMLVALPRLKLWVLIKGRVVEILLSCPAASLALVGQTRHAAWANVAP